MYSNKIVGDVGGGAKKSAFGFVEVVPLVFLVPPDKVSNSANFQIVLIDIS